MVNLNIKSSAVASASHPVQDDCGGSNAAAYWARLVVEILLLFLTSWVSARPIGKIYRSRPRAAVRDLLVVHTSAR